MDIPAGLSSYGRKSPIALPMSKRARQDAEREAYKNYMSLETYLNAMESKKDELARWEKMRMDAPDKVEFDKKTNPYIAENWGITVNEPVDKTGSLMWSEAQEREQQEKEQMEPDVVVSGPVIRGVGLRGRAVPVSAVKTTSKVAYIPSVDQVSSQSSPLRGLTTKTGTVRKSL